MTVDKIEAVVFLNFECTVFYTLPSCYCTTSIRGGTLRTRPSPLPKAKKLGWITVASISLALPSPA